ncbi:VOC family protein [Alteribacillus sp. HJP-4]|uniref:VOC family protein n=1 Tax=Alteribacillus sp. HJP-4 TaxID=2775394 RepID=UPI0035CCC8FC
MCVNHIDHAAIRVQDLEHSATWYQKVLSFQRVQNAQIGSIPVILKAGNTMINLFPAATDVYPFHDDNENAVMHLAFNVEDEKFDRMKHKFQNMDIKYEVIDRGVCLSLYFSDPDHNKLELTYWKVSL